MATNLKVVQQFSLDRILHAYRLGRIVIPFQEPGSEKIIQRQFQFVALSRRTGEPDTQYLELQTESGRAGWVTLHLKTPIEGRYWGALTVGDDPPTR